MLSPVLQLPIEQMLTRSGQSASQTPNQLWAEGTRKDRWDERASASLHHAVEQGGRPLHSSVVGGWHGPSKQDQAA